MTFYLVKISLSRGKTSDDCVVSTNVIWADVSFSKGARDLFSVDFAS